MPKQRYDDPRSSGSGGGPLSEPACQQDEPKGPVLKKEQDEVPKPLRETETSSATEDPSES